MAAEYEKTHEMVEQFRELSPVWLSRFPFNSRSMRHALEEKKRELKAVKMTALKQKEGLQLVISQLGEVKDEYDMNQSQSQTVSQDLISKMNQDIEYIQSKLDWIGLYYQTLVNVQLTVWLPVVDNTLE